MEATANTGIFKSFKWLGDKKDFLEMAKNTAIALGEKHKAGKMLDVRMFILGTIGGKDVLEVRFVKLLSGETLEQAGIRIGIPMKTQKDKLIDEYTKRLNNLKENQAAEENARQGGLSDHERQDYETQIRLTAEFIQNLKSLK